MAVINTFEKLPDDSTNTGKLIDMQAFTVAGQTVNRQRVNAAAYVLASNGELVPVDSLAQTNTVTAGLITATSVTYEGITYVQTLTYTAGIVTAISQWVAQ